VSERLAVDGGSPVRKKLLPYGRQSIDEADIAAVVEVLGSDWITTGPKVGEFEEAVAEYVGARHAVAYSSGTAALHGAVFAGDIGAGDEVVTTPMTFAATANCVLYQGGTPVFADVADDTLNVDPDLVARAISAKTKALIAVDYAGHPADLDELLAVAERPGLLLIEDACHAIGATYRGRQVGSISDMTIFSFHPVKHITTGEGGIVTTDDDELASRLRRFRSHGIASDPRERQEKGQWHYEMVDLGFNYRLTDIASALGLSQLGKLDANLKRRREIAAMYTDALADLPLRTPSVREGVEPAWHLYPIRLNLEALRVGRAEVFAALRAEGLGVNVHYIPVHLHPYYRERFGYSDGAFPVAEQAYEELISLPMFHAMTDEDVHDVVRAVTKVLDHYAVDRDRLAL
jgi:perosamine synthetase